MADCGVYAVPDTCRDKLEEYLRILTKYCDSYTVAEVRHLFHHTMTRYKVESRRTGIITGECTASPSRSPLASFPELKGVWFSLSTRELPSTSSMHTGVHQLKFDIKDMFAYMSKPIKDVVDEHSSSSMANASEGTPLTKNRGKKHSKKNTIQLNNYQGGNQKKEQPHFNEESLKREQEMKMPLLFFEHAHFHENIQCVRLVLMRAHDENVDWCRDNLVEVDVTDNPFLELQQAGYFTIGNRTVRVKEELYVEILITGDIYFNSFSGTPQWEEVLECDLLGFKPKLGAMHNISKSLMQPYVPQTNQNELNYYWECLMKHADFYDSKREIKYILNCTSLARKRSVKQTGMLIGIATDHPVAVPLAFNPRLKGIWFEPSVRELPKKSPYGCQRIKFKMGDVLKYISSNDEIEKKRNIRSLLCKSFINEQEEPSVSHQTIALDSSSEELKAQAVACDEDVDNGDKLVLFFEHAHYYNKPQYVRLVSIGSNNKCIQWCRENLKEIDIQRNPYFILKNGRVYSYVFSESGERKVFLEILIPGDIVIQYVEQSPVWDNVSKAHRAGYSPHTGVS